MPRAPAQLTGTERFRGLEGRIREILDSDARIPTIQKEGRYYYNFWRDAKNPRGLWRRTTLDEYRKEKPAWEVVLDLDELARQEHENWVWHGAQTLRPEHRLALISLSRGGADASVVREFDLEKKSFIKDGYALPEAKSQVSWRDADSVFVGTELRPGLADRFRICRGIVKEWKRGTPLTAAAVVFEGRAEDMGVSAHRDLTPGFERDVITRRPTFFTSETFLRRDGKLVKIDKPDDSQASFHREWLLLRLRTDWKPSAGRTYPAGALLAIDLEAFLKGDRGFDVLFEPTERKSLASFSPTRHFIMLNELDNVRSRIEVLTFRDRGWQRRADAGPARSRRCERPCDRPRGLGRLLPHHHRLPDPDDPGDGHRRRRSARDAQAAPGVLRREGPGRHPARGHLPGRHPHPLFPGRPRRAVPRRHQSDVAHRLRRVPAREEAGVRSHDQAPPGWRRGECSSSPISAAAASSGRSGTVPP